MTKGQQKTAIIVGASVAIGFLGDLVMYSLAVSKGSKFKIHVPKGKDLFQVLAIGFVTGLIIDKSISLIENKLKSEQEKTLDSLVAQDLKKVESGELSDSLPVQISWMKSQEIKNKA